MKRILFISLFFITHAIAAPENNTDFSYQGQPINPACIALFNNSLSDFPYISAINLDNCQNSNAAYQKTMISPEGWVFYYINNKDSSQGIYRYRLIGKSENNIYVLNTENNGGGTSTFTDLLLIRLVSKKIAVFNRSSTPEIKTYLQLELLGYVIGGDRCVGSFSDVTIKSNLLLVTQHNGNFPYECDKMQKFIIDLSKLKE